MSTRTARAPHLQPTAVTEAAQTDASLRIFLAVIVTAVLTSVLTGSMVNVLLPEMKETFGASSARIGWVVTAYSLVYAIGIPLYGRISDFLGARALFTGGLIAFAVGSLTSALAPTFPLLMLGRIIQGSGGAAIAALAFVVIAQVMPEDRRGAALGLVASMAGAGAAIGPFAGGFIGESIGWRGLFIVPMLLILVILPLARRAIPDTRRTLERRFDIIGGVLLGLAAGLFLFGITRGQTSGYGSFAAAGSFLGAIVAAAGFAWRITSTPYPFVSPDLFRNRAYMRVVATGFFTSLSYMSSLVLVPLMLIEFNDLSIREAGLALTPGAIAAAVVSRYAGRISDRIGSRTPIIAGLILFTIAVVYMSTFAAGASAWAVAAGVFVIGAGNSMVNSPLSNAASHTLDEAETGVGMGLFAGASFFGAGTGPAVIGAWLDARQNANTGPLNILHSSDAAAWSDAFLLVLVMLLVSLAVATTIQSSKNRDA